MSGGQWSYNRFDEYEKQLAEKKAAKDYDGDGKVESSKEEYFGSKDKAIKKAMGKTVNEKKELPDFIKKKMDEKEGKDGKKESKKDDCECKEEVELDEGSCGGGYQKGGEVKPKKDTKKKEYKKPNPVTGVYEEKTVVKEDVLKYIMEKGMANNIVSAEVLFDHISDEFLESIEEQILTTD